jgi:hypothetical protein
MRVGDTEDQRNNRIYNNRHFETTVSVWLKLVRNLQEGEQLTEVQEKAIGQLCELIMVEINDTELIPLEYRHWQTGGHTDSFPKISIGEIYKTTYKEVAHRLAITSGGVYNVNTDMFEVA